MHQILRLLLKGNKILRLFSSHSLATKSTSSRDLLAIPEWKMIPILILGNKIDRSQAVSEEQLRDSLGNIITTSTRVSLRMCSVLKKVGYGAGQPLIHSCYRNRIPMVG